MIFVYGDESMDEMKERVCTVAALIGTKEQWEAIQALWTERTNGISFHAKDCDSDRGDFRDSPHAENKALYRDLITLLSRSGIRGFAASVDLAAQCRAFPNANIANLRKQSYFQAFMDVVEKMVRTAESENEIAEITFDSRMETEHNAALLYANMRELNPGWESRIASRLIFESSRGNPRLQVADLFAREAMKAFDNELGPVKRPVRKSWVALYETGNFVAFGYGDQWFTDLKNDNSSPFKLKREEYLAWLGNRQDNITAFIEYTRIRFKIDSQKLN